MRRSWRTALPLAAAATLLAAGPASAQQSTTRGLVLGLHVSGASLVVQSDNDERNNAGGGGLLIGYGLNRRATIFVQADGAEFDEQSTGDVEGALTMGHFDLGVRFNFANSLRRWVPFLQGAIGYRAVSVTDPVVNGVERNDVTFSGAGLSFGGGVDIYFSESFALDLQLLWTGGEFTTLTVDNVSVTGFDVDATSTRFNVGLAWWP
jgi:hypothetical protein